jgi:hypothetical protein
MRFFSPIVAHSRPNEKRNGHETFSYFSHPPDFSVFSPPVEDEHAKKEPLSAKNGKSGRYRSKTESEAYL